MMRWGWAPKDRVSHYYRDYPDSIYPDRFAISACNLRLFNWKEIALAYKGDESLRCRKCLRSRIGNAARGIKF